MKMLKGHSLLVLLSLGVLVAVAVLAAEAGGATVTVPDDYPTIQSAIDNATDYDTVLVKDGLYEESVVVYRPLTITGESRDGTVISMDDPFSMLIVAQKATVSHMTVQGTRTGAGLILQGSYCVIEDVTVRQNVWGLWVNRGFHNVVRDVLCIDNDWQGLLVEEADHTLVEDVTCSGNDVGVMVRGAVDTTIQGCTLSGNRIHGLEVMRNEMAYYNDGLLVVDCVISNNMGSGCNIYHIDHVTLDRCIVEDNAWAGIRTDKCNETIIRNCTVRNFTRFGLVYVGNDLSGGCLLEDNLVEDEGTSWSVIMVRDSSDCIVRNNRVTCLNTALSVYSMNDTLVTGNVLVSTNDNASYVTRGLLVGRPAAGVGDVSFNVTVSDCTVRGFTKGIVVNAGSDVIVSGCTVTDCLGDGIVIEANPHGDMPMDGGAILGCTLMGCGIDVQGMRDVSVKGNNISGAEAGVEINGTSYPVDGNIFLANWVRDCTGFGLLFTQANGSNLFYLNSFVGNAVPSSAPGAGDAFDDGKVGNHWSDYPDRYPDAERLGVLWDTPYAVGTSSVLDRFPLAYEYDEEPPVAEAGEPQVVSAGTVVTLDGSGSTDPQGVTSFTWTFEYSDITVRLDGRTVTFPFLLIGDYYVTLDIKDVWGNEARDQTLVVVRDDEDPVADAGEDVDAPMGTSFALSGSASSDNGFITRYEWHIDPEGLDRVLEGETVTFAIDDPGQYVVVLRVWDEAGNTDFDEVTVTVLDTEAPVADAGRDLSVDQGEQVTLIGSWCRDNVAVFSWTWTFTEAGVVVIEVGELVSRAFPLAGEYTISLNVTDAAGNWDVDEVVLTVRDTELPVADAGEDLEVDQWATVTFDATGSSDNVGIVEYIWTIAEGSDISRMFGAHPEHIFGISGTITIELEVWDAAGNVQYDSLLVTVNPVPTTVLWRLGPFKDDGGLLGGVRVETVLSGSSHVGYTGDDGWVEYHVIADDLVSPASVTATKEGWGDISFQVTLDDDGGPTGTIPVMKRAGGGGGDDDDELEDTLPWVLVVVLIVAYAGTLWYLSNAARRAGGE